MLNLPVYLTSELSYVIVKSKFLVGALGEKPSTTVNFSPTAALAGAEIVTERLSAATLLGVNNNISHRLIRR